MFTGLIQSLGSLYRAGDTQLRIICNAHGRERILHDIELGDSIAVDGVCLTVEQQIPSGFIATASPETLQRTTLGHLPDGTKVNLETSLRIGSKIGGHFVTGHVDGTGTLERVSETTDTWELEFAVSSPSVARYIVAKGSVAVNGISLTIANCSPPGDWFTVAVIPVTYRETNLHSLSPGQPINLEGDILGKYVDRFMRSPYPAQENAVPSLSMEFLASQGYL